MSLSDGKAWEDEFAQPEPPRSGEPPTIEQVADKLEGWKGFQLNDRSDLLFVCERIIDMYKALGAAHPSQAVAPPETIQEPPVCCGVPMKRFECCPKHGEFWHCGTCDVQKPVESAAPDGVERMAREISACQCEGADCRGCIIHHPDADRRKEMALAILRRHLQAEMSWTVVNDGSKQWEFPRDGAVQAERGAEPTCAGCGEPYPCRHDCPAGVIKVSSPDNSQPSDTEQWIRVDDAIRLLGVVDKSTVKHLRMAARLLRTGTSPSRPGWHYEDRVYGRVWVEDEQVKDNAQKLAEDFINGILQEPLLHGDEKHREWLTNELRSTIPHLVDIIREYKRED